MKIGDKVRISLLGSSFHNETGKIVSIDENMCIIDVKGLMYRCNKKYLKIENVTIEFHEESVKQKLNL